MATTDWESRSDTSGSKAKSPTQTVTKDDLSLTLSGKSGALSSELA